MPKNSTPLLVLASVFAFAAAGCASAPKAPFDTLKDANVTMYHLQNYEPPAQAATPGAAAPLQIPGLSPELQALLQQGAQALPQLIPPGLIPPNLLPGAAPAAPPAPTDPRFHNFRIIRQSQVMDPDLKEQLAKVLGDEDSFDNTQIGCAPGTIYPEIGLSWSMGPGASNDMLISFLCSNAVSRSFAWPHPATGTKEDTEKKIDEIFNKIFPRGA
jgi:hypothetical protein